MKYYLGIDGGGTKTVAAVLNEEGKLSIKATGKSINFYSVGMKTAKENLAAVVNEIYSSLKIKGFESVFIGCSALDGEADDKLINELCDGVINARKIKMNSDVYIALKSVGKVECPCVAICGTGSMAIAEDINGNIRVKGGWGHIIGDEGSGYSIAVEALKSCCAFYDGGEEHPLLRNAECYFGVEDFRKAIDIIYSPETSKDVLAGFSEKVGMLADSGDETAKYIILNEARKFSKTVIMLLDEIKSCSVLGLYGGLFQHNEFFTTCFVKEIKSRYPDLTIKALDIPPEERAAELARGLL